jgi:hypothetical protein
LAGPGHTNGVLVFVAGGREVRIRSLNRRGSLLHAPIYHDRLLGELKRKVGFSASEILALESKSRKETTRGLIPFPQRRKEEINSLQTDSFFFSFPTPFPFLFFL